MRDHLCRTQICYGAFLSVLLVSVFLPMSLGWKILSIAGILFVTAGLFWQLNDRRKRLLEGSDNIAVLAKKLDTLPSRQRYRLPVLLVTGNAAKVFFAQDHLQGESHVIVSSEAIWIYTEEPSELSLTYDSLVSRWPDMQGRTGVFFAICPETEDKLGLFIAKLNAFRQSWADTSRIANYYLPVYVSVHVGLNNIQHNGEAPLPVHWYQLFKNKLYLLDGYLTPLKNWVNINQLKAAERKQRYYFQAMLNETRQWIADMVLSALTNPDQPLAKCVPVGTTIFPINNEVKQHNVFDAHFSAKTTLSLPNDTPITSRVTVPDSLVKHMPMAYPFSPFKKMLFGIIIMTCVFLMGCLLSSYWNNQKLISVIEQNIHQYEVIADDNYAEKAEALRILKDDRNRLNAYFQKGEPLWLGFGLYRGYRMLEPLNQAIGRYVPPPPAPEKLIVKETEVVMKAPEVIRLDSLSLFETGQSELKPRSNKILIESLMALQSKIKEYKGKGWLILIAGHTDTVGDMIKNQQLSLSRATAVREWIINNSDIPETCFATQGYGAKKPLVNNDTPEERAKNRRVEISLIPHITSCL